MHLHRKDINAIIYAACLLMSITATFSGLKAECASILNKLIVDTNLAEIKDQSLAVKNDLPQTTEANLVILGSYCDLDDVDEQSNIRFQRPRTIWSKADISYSIPGNLPQYGDLTWDELKLIVSEAFKFWSDVSGLRFHLVAEASKADIVIEFRAGDHGDGYTFNRSIKAHAFWPGPGIGGDLHFNSELFWTSDRSGENSLYYTCIHEIGHSLGLDHSDDNLSIMSPIYRQTNKQPQLSEEEKQQLKKLYWHVLKT